MLKWFKKYPHVFKDYSFTEIFRIFVLILRNLFYGVIFGLNRWHLSNIRYFRQYQETSIRILNFLKPKVLIEFGCGLGEISRNISKLDCLILIDNDPQIIKILKVFKKRNEIVAQFDFCDSKEVVFFLKTLGIVKVDVIVAVNFLHQTELKKIVETFAVYRELLGVEDVLIDLAVEGESGFRHPITMAKEIGTITNFSEIKEKFTQDTFRWGLCLIKLDSKSPEKNPK